MNHETLAYLQSTDGQALLAELAARNLTEAGQLRELTRLRRHYPAEVARAAVEQTLLRQRARAKFPQAEQMFFTREALEQASSAAVAAHRARRFADYAHVADLGCGIGGDALALAAAGRQVTAVDRDEVRLALARANAAALGLAAQMTFIQADLLVDPPPPADALFCDPGRRSGGRRRFRVEQYEPPLAHVLGWRAQIPALAVKLAPGVDLAELAALDDCEVEFVSLNGELKEAVLWSGPPATTTRRATLLRSATDAAGAVTSATLTAEPTHSPTPLSPPDALLYEPDPAVLRAGLVGTLAAHLGAAQLDPDIAYLTAPELQPTPFARAWRILEWLPFNLKRLRARLRTLDAGPVTVKKRGSPLDTDALAKQLSGLGACPLVVVLTRVEGRPAALICTNL
ncbi:MAG: class I SAM-dependent methyltransferase [Chloroflexaceae bacterium]